MLQGHSAILSPSLSYHLSLSGCFTQVLLYFTVAFSDLVHLNIQHSISVMCRVWTVNANISIAVALDETRWKNMNNHMIGYAPIYVD